jgi:D-alanine-D-alanine ligase
LLETICPAVVDDKLKNKIISSAILAHKSIGARHYSLFDFRIDERTNEPIFLEAGLFWSFSKASMISKMLLAGGQDLVKIIDKVWSDALVNF